MKEHYSNPVGRLQEHCQAMAESSPMYQLLITEGPCHSPIFTMQVLYQGFSATGSGTSKKEAKSKAAQAMLRLIQWGEEGMEFRSTQGQGIDGVCMNVVGKLQKQSMVHKLGLPVYQDLGMEGLGYMPTFTFTVGEWKAEGRGTNKKEAKKNSAKMVLNCMMAEIGKEENMSWDIDKEGGRNIDDKAIIDDNIKSKISAKMKTEDNEAFNMFNKETESIDKSTNKEIEETENSDLSSKEGTGNEESNRTSTNIDTEHTESSNMSYKEETEDTAAPPKKTRKVSSSDRNRIELKEIIEEILR